MNLSSRTKAYILLLINTIIWGASLQIVKNSYEFTDPFRFLFYRFSVASVLSVPIIIYFVSQKKKYLHTTFKIITLELLGVTLTLSLLYLGLSQTSSIEASLIATTSPLFTVLGGIIFLKEKQERHEAIGLVFAFTGTLLLTLIPFFNKVGVNMEMSLLGSMLILLNNISGATYFILAKKTYTYVPKLYAAGISFFVGMISFLVISALSAGSYEALRQSISSDLQHWEVIFAAVYMGALGSVVALTAYLKGQSLIEVSEASLFYYLQPLIFIPLGVLWLEENIYLIQIIALIIVIAGVAIASYRKPRSKKHHQPLKKGIKQPLDSQYLNVKNVNT